jgi:hypothetical protein
MCWVLKDIGKMKSVDRNVTGGQGEWNEKLRSHWREEVD